MSTVSVSRDFEGHFNSNINSMTSNGMHGTTVMFTTVSSQNDSTGAHFSIIPSRKIKDKVAAGEGGFGIVYKANHEDWGVVAIKQLKAEHIQEKQLKKLRKEAEKLAELSHGNVIQLYGVILDSSNYAVVLEYMTHGALDEFLETYQVSWDIKIRMTHQVTLGMNYLHTYDQPIIHRDLKASNVLVGDNLDVKISDFGLSEWRSFSVRTSQHQPARCGTVTHIPPESWDDINRKPDVYFDVYSFGILSWELLTERRPFEGAQDAQISHCVSRGQRPTPDLIPADAPPLLVTLMEVCWQQEPEKRPLFKDLKEKLETEFVNNPEYEFEQKTTSGKISLLMQINSGVSSMLNELDLYSPEQQDTERTRAQVNGCALQLAQKHQTRVAGDADQCQEDIEAGLLMGPAPDQTQPVKPNLQVTRMYEPCPAGQGNAHAQGLAHENCYSSNSTDHPIQIYDFKPAERGYGLQLSKTPMGKSPVNIEVKGKNPKVYQLPREQPQKVYKVCPQTVEIPSLDPSPKVPNVSIPGRTPPGVPSSGGLSNRSDVTTDSVPVKEKKEDKRSTKGSASNNMKQPFNPFGPDFMANFNFAGATHGIHNGSTGTTVFNVDNIEGLQIGDRNVMYITTGSAASRGSKGNQKRVVKIKITDSEAVVDDKNMLMVAEHLGGEWRLLGHRLGFSDGQLDAVDSDFHSHGLKEKIYQMLRQWREQKGHKAQLKILANALIDCGKGNLAGRVKEPTETTK